jgi:hypothetical protein
MGFILSSRKKPLARPLLIDLIVRLVSMAKNKNFIRNALITVYILIVLGFSATSRADMSIEQPINVPQASQAKDFTGELAMSTDGRFFLVVSDKEYYELETSADLTQFNGDLVVVRGIEPKCQIQPVVQVASLDPLDEAQRKPVPALVVLGISELAK